MQLTSVVVLSRKLAEHFNHAGSIRPLFKDAGRTVKCNMFKLCTNYMKYFVNMVHEDAKKYLFTHLTLYAT